MRWAVLIGSVVFLAAMTAIALTAFDMRQAEPPLSAQSLPDAMARQFTTTQVATHGTRSDCWLIIDRRVYDVTGYIDQHPVEPTTILRYCGKEATRGFDTKDRGRDHSAYAHRLLEAFFRGNLVLTVTRCG